MESGYQNAVPAPRLTVFIPSGMYRIEGRSMKPSQRDFSDTKRPVFSRDSLKSLHLAVWNYDYRPVSSGALC